MEMLSLKYVILCAGILLLFQMAPVRYRPAVLSVASFLVYAMYSVLSSAILLALTVAVFNIGQRIERASTDRVRHALLLGSVSILLAHLVLIKFIPILRGKGYPSPGARFLTAIGVSYFTFKLLGYLIDIYWGKYPAWRDFAGFAAFAAFFPQLPAGPIQRADEWSVAAGAPGAELMVAGLRRILLGYVKKVVVADQLGAVVAFIASVQPGYGNLVWVAAYLYAVQLYADFSALSDIAIGSAALFGIRSPENFDFPFFAATISQFWRRWHMTLTRWLTDYVFTPLRMASRNLGNWGLALSITINMVLIGLWHGFTMGFLVFGLLHSIYLIADSLTAQQRRRYYKSHPLAERLTNIAGPFVVFHMVALSLIFFRTPTWGDALYNLRHLPDGLAAPLASLKILAHGYGHSAIYAGLALLAFAGWEICLYLRKQGWKPALSLPRFAHLPLPVRWATYYAALALATLLRQSASHFIYVQF